MLTLTKRQQRFIDGYIDCLLWAETDDDCEPLEDNYGRDDISPEAMQSIQDDCLAFLSQAERFIDDDYFKGSHGESTIDEYAGHDFWLTRNGHGAGFWDGDWRKPVGDELTRIAKTFRETSPYVGDDGLIYLM